MKLSYLIYLALGFSIAIFISSLVQMIYLRQAEKRAIIQAIQKRSVTSHELSYEKMLAMILLLSLSVLLLFGAWAILVIYFANLKLLPQNDLSLLIMIAGGLFLLALFFKTLEKIKKWARIGFIEIQNHRMRYQNSKPSITIEIDFDHPYQVRRTITIPWKGPKYINISVKQNEKEIAFYYVPEFFQSIANYQIVNKDSTRGIYLDVMGRAVDELVGQKP